VFTKSPSVASGLAGSVSKASVALPPPITLYPPETKVLGLLLKVSSTSVPLLAEMMEETLVVVATPSSKLSTPLRMRKE